MAELAPQYQAELGLTQGRRTALLIAVMLVLQPVLWDHGLPLIGGDGHLDQDATSAVVDSAVKWLGSSAIVLALLVAAACGLGQRYVGLPGRLLRAAGGLGLAVAVVFTTTGGVLSMLSEGDWWTAIDGLPSVLAFLVLPMGWVAISARRCLALT